MDCPNCGAFNSILDTQCRCGHVFTQKRSSEKPTQLPTDGTVAVPAMRENDAPLEVHARPTKRDVMLAKLHWYFRSSIGWRWTVGGLIGPFALFAMYSGIAGRPWDGEHNYVLFIGPSLAIGLLLLVAFGGMNTEAMQAYLRDGSRYVFTSVRVEVTGPLASSKLDWRVFTKAYESADAFILLVGVTLHVVPKRDFGSEADVTRLRALLTQRLRANAHLEGQ